MLKSTIDKWRGSEPPQETIETPAVVDMITIEVAKLKEVLAGFKIGSRVHYFPESVENREVESMILGYSINGRHVFSTQEIGEPDSDLILKGGEGAEIKYAEVSEFYIILPRTDCPSDESDDKETGPKNSNRMARRTSRQRMLDRAKQQEKKVRSYTNDFPREAEIGLQAVSATGGVPSMDSIVKRSSRLQDGVFVNQSVVFLEPRYQTLSKVDRRSFCRVQTEIPVQIMIAKSDTHVSCTLSNFSEQHFRIAPVNSDPAWLDLKVGHSLVIKIKLPETDKQFIVNTKITRWTTETAVVELSEILHGEKFVPISPLDQLEIKSALLEHPQSR